MLRDYRGAHHPERVSRQFGDVQVVPPACGNDEALHKMDRRGNPQHNWTQVHAKWIQLWNDREKSLQAVAEVDDEDEAIAQYMAWYARITRCLISPPASAPAGVYQAVAPDYHMMGNFVMDVSARATQTAEELHNFYAAHQYNSMMRKMDEYCNYMTAQGSQLLSQVSYNPTQPQISTEPRVQRPPQPEMPPTGYRVSSQPEMQIPSSMVFPSYPSYGTPGGTPPFMMEPYNQPRFIFPQSTFVARGRSTSTQLGPAPTSTQFGPAPTSTQFGHAPTFLTTPPCHHGRIVYANPNNLYGATRPPRPGLDPNLFSQPEVKEDE